MWPRFWPIWHCGRRNAIAWWCITDWVMYKTSYNDSAFLNLAHPAKSSDRKSLRTYSTANEKWRGKRIWNRSLNICKWIQYIFKGKACLRSLNSFQQACTMFVIMKILRFIYSERNIFERVARSLDDILYTFTTYQRSISSLTKNILKKLIILMSNMS